MARRTAQSRWPDEMDALTRLGLENLDAIEQTVARYGMDCDFERTGMLAVAIEPHQVKWLAEPDAADGSDVYLDGDAVRGEIASPTYLAGRWDRRSTAMVHPAKLAAELARVITDLGVVVHEGTAVRRIDDGEASVEVVTDRGTVRAPRVALATNAFPSLLKRNRLMTVPVYDYVLMSEPLTAAQLGEIGWRHRQGVSDLANQFHYYRLSADNRILFGGYDAIYHAGRSVRAEYEDRRSSFEKLASHFATTFPQLEGVGFTHRWVGPDRRQHPLLRVLRLGPARPRRLRGRIHGPRRRRRPIRRRRDARPARRPRDRAHVARDGRGSPVAVPAGAGRLDRHPAHEVVARPGRSPRGTSQPAAEGRSTRSASDSTRDLALRRPAAGTRTGSVRLSRVGVRCGCCTALRTRRRDLACR